ncbi:MAG TPA: glycosyltransferase [Acetobacteraceae bacterium]|nr:glycosyltransferase [Acetobacteraceae bacterium]
MRYLFVHQNFPGQYLHVVRHLLTNPENDIVFISEPNQNHLQGVRRVSYQVPKYPQDPIHPNARDYEVAARRADIVARTAENVKRLGFTPDIVVGHHGWGELLNLVDVWPRAPILGYFEFYYQTVGQDVGYDAEFPIEPERFARIRAMNIVNHLALGLEQHGQTPTHWQHERYPLWARHLMKVVPEGARLDLCKPDPSVRKQPFTIGNLTIQPNEKLVTYVSRNLEPYRGFHTMMRALPYILGERADTRVIMIGGDEVSYGARLVDTTWREHFQKELAGKYDESRVLLPGQIPYETYRTMLQRSDAHVYLTYPFVASWSLREAMACGCAIVAADVDPVAEFITHDETGILTSGLDAPLLARRVLEILEDGKLSRRLRTAARRYAEAHLDMNQHLTAFDARVAEITGAAASPAPKRKRKGPGAHSGA